MAAEHYTAVVEITKTTHTPAPADPSSRRFQSSPPESRREVVEVARVVLRAESLERLRDRLGAHVALIEEA